MPDSPARWFETMATVTSFVQSADRATHPVHPLGSRAKVLLASVFGPYARDDEYGSRALNPMELYHNQVTRVQGPFSLRMFHRSWGLMLIQANLQARCALLDFPTLERFIEEIRDGHYDVVGIGAIPLNVGKVRKMCEVVRQYSPQTTIVVGGHVANVAGLERQIDADYIVQGEGVRWFRQFLGEDPQEPLRHPLISSGIGTRSLGITLKDSPGSVAAALLPSVGCPVGCNFCATSAMFGGKGKFINFYQTGDELFDVMCQLEDAMQVQSFFVMDENFLLHRRRALRVLELMQQHDKAWSLYVFSSANVLSNYTLDQLVAMGVSWVWIGLEGEDADYTKLRNVDTRALVRRLQSRGIHVLGSTIIGLENHTPENIDAAIEYAVGHDADFHQFMLYTPVVGTPLYAELAAQGRIKGDEEIHPGDVHGQYLFNYRHPHITGGQEAEFMVRAFRRDLDANGPSILRIARTTLAGWKRHRHNPDPRVRRRFAREAKDLAIQYAAVAWAARKYFRHQPHLRAKMSQFLDELYREFGIKSRLVGPIAGPYLLWKIKREAKRLAAGWTYEPPTFYEKNFDEPEPAGRPAATRCQFVTPRVALLSGSQAQSNIAERE